MVVAKPFFHRDKPGGDCPISFPTIREGQEVSTSHLLLPLFPHPCPLSPFATPKSYPTRHPKVQVQELAIPPLRGVAPSLVLGKSVWRVGEVAGRIGDRQLAGLRAELLNWRRRDANLQS